MKTITVEVRTTSKAAPRQYRLRVEQEIGPFEGQPTVHRVLYELGRRGLEADRVGEVNSPRGLYQLVRSDWILARRVGAMDLTEPEIGYLRATAGAIIHESIFDPEVTVTVHAREADLGRAWDEAIEEALGGERRDYDAFASTWSRSLPGGHYDGGDD